MTTLMVIDGQRPDETRTQVVARRIKGEIAQIGLSMSKAAARVGMSQQKFSRRMTGNVTFDIEELDLLCRQLGISFEYVTSGIRALPTGPGNGLLLPRLDSNQEPSGEYLDLDLPAVSGM